MSAAFDGSPLRGNRIVRLVYLDEAGISNPKQEPFLVVAGVTVQADTQFKEIEKYLDELADKHVPNRKKGEFAFHAMELFHGTKNFDRQIWAFEKRLEILDDLASIPKKFDLPICWGVTDRIQAPEAISVPVEPQLLEQIVHSHAFFKFVTQIEVVMRASAQSEVAMLIAEDRPIMRKMLKMSHAMFRGRAPIKFQDVMKEIFADEEDPLSRVYNKIFPLDRIVETVHFAEKTESSLLQVADICAFAIKRHIMKASHADRLYEPLKDQIVFTPSVVEALASTVQPA